MTGVMSLTVWFIGVSLLVACLVLAETMVLARHHGKMPQSSAFAVVSLLTSAWTVACCAALYFLDFGRIGISVAIVYPLYALLGFIYNARLVKDEDLPDDPMDLVVPKPYLQFCQSFALVYALLCVIALAEELKFFTL